MKILSKGAFIISLALFMCISIEANAGCITEKISKIEIQSMVEDDCFVSVAEASTKTSYILHFESGGAYKLDHYAYNDYGPFTPGMVIEICTHNYSIKSIKILK